MKRTLAILLALVMLLSLSAAAFADGLSGKVMLYSSMQEAQLWIWSTTMPAAASWSRR